jgi:hypothetical protein
MNRGSGSPRVPVAIRGIVFQCVNWWFKPFQKQFAVRICYPMFGQKMMPCLTHAWNYLYCCQVWVLSPSNTVRVTWLWLEVTPMGSFGVSRYKHWTIWDQSCGSKLGAVPAVPLGSLIFVWGITGQAETIRNLFQKTSVCGDQGKPTQKETMNPGPDFLHRLHYHW